MLQNAMFLELTLKQIPEAPWRQGYKLSNQINAVQKAYLEKKDINGLQKAQAEALNFAKLIIAVKHMEKAKGSERLS